MLALLLASLVNAQDAQVEIEHFAQSGPLNDAVFKTKMVQANRVGVGVSPSTARLPDALAIEIFESAQALVPGFEELVSGKLTGGIRLPWICANLRDAAGKPVTPTHRPFQLGNAKLAVIGIVQPPEYYKLELKGWSLADAADALKAALAEAKGADAIILAAVMDRLECAALLNKFPEISLAIVPAIGTNDPEPVTIGGQTLVQSPVGVGTLGRLKFKAAAGKLEGVSNKFEKAEPTAQDAERVRALYKKHSYQNPLERLADAPPPVPIETAVTSLEPGKSAAVRAIRSNRAAEVTLHTAQLLAEFAGRKPPEGCAWLALDMEWKNIIPLSFIYENQVPTMYKVPEPANYLYVIANGRRVARLDAELSSGPGGLLEHGLDLPRLGAVRRGVALFPVSAQGLETLELRFYDYAHGNMQFPVLQRPKDARVEPPRPAGAAGKNEILELGVFDLRKAPEWRGNKAPDGMTYVVADLLARSVFEIDADATAYDPKAKKGQKIKIGTVVDWGDCHKLIHLVRDGEFSHEPVENALPETPRFLSEIMTGETLVFLVPDKASSLELRCDFPAGHVPGHTEPIHPKSITILLEGKRPEAPKAEAIAKVDDDIFRVSVTGQTTAAEFAGAAAGEDEAFLILDVTVENRGKGTETFQTQAQLKYVTEKGQQTEFDGASLKGPRPAAEMLSIPAGERRSFQVVYRIPKTDRRFRLAYSGVSKAEILNLKGAAAPPVCPQCGKGIEATDKFCGSCGAKLK